MRSALSRKALLADLRAKKIVDIVPEEVRQIYTLLESDFSPLELCAQVMVASFQSVVLLYSCTGFHTCLVCSEPRQFQASCPFKNVGLQRSKAYSTLGFSQHQMITCKHERLV